MAEFALRVPGTSCGHCARWVRAVSAHVADIPGVTAVQVDLDTRILRVSGTATADALRAAVQNALHERNPACPC
jgi:copper chaperone CopZ